MFIKIVYQEDGIEKVRLFDSVDSIGYQTKRIDNVRILSESAFLIMSNKSLAVIDIGSDELKEGEESGRIVTIISGSNRNSDNKELEIYTYDSEMYIMNDNGKTVEKFYA